MGQRFDLRSFVIMAAALALGLAWAAYNLIEAGVGRTDATVRPLVWVMFSTPAALFVGWLAARRRELGLAAFCCFCLYFFTFFVAQRIQSLLMTREEAVADGNRLHFTAAIVIHALVGLALAIWRARQPPAAAASPADPVTG